MGRTHAHTAIVAVIVVVVACFGGCWLVIANEARVLRREELGKGYGLRGMNARGSSNQPNRRGPKRHYHKGDDDDAVASFVNEIESAMVRNEMNNAS